MKSYVTKDSGQRQQFSTGSVRDLNVGKGRFDLIPTLPLRRLAGLYERGAAKYGDRNWEKGQPLMRYVDSAMRHINCLVAGEPEEDHAAAIAWNMFGLMYTLAAIEAGRLPKELDDRPPPEPQYEKAVEVRKPSKGVRLVDTARAFEEFSEAIRGSFKDLKIQIRTPKKRRRG